MLLPLLPRIPKRLNFVFVFNSVEVFGGGKGGWFQVWQSQFFSGEDSGSDWKRWHGPISHPIPPLLPITSTHSHRGENLPLALEVPTNLIYSHSWCTVVEKLSWRRTAHFKVLYSAHVTFPGIRRDHQLLHVESKWLHWCRDTSLNSSLAVDLSRVPEDTSHPGFEN